MTKTRSILFGAIAALVVLGAVAGCQPEPEPIKIGVIFFDMEGEATKAGLNGMQLFVEEINERGGLRGQEVELVVVESVPADEELAFQALEEIEQTHHPLAYISFGDNVAVIVAEFAEEHEVVHIASYAVGDVTSGKEWVFRYHTSLQGYLGVAAFLFIALEAEEVSFIYNTDVLFGPFMSTVTGEMLQNPTLDIEFNSFGNEDTDFREQITKSLDSDFIFAYTTDSNQIHNLILQIRELGYQGNIVTMKPYKDPLNPDLPEFIGVYAGASIIYKTDFLFAQDLRERYEEEYETTPFSFFSGYAAEGYDSIRLIAELLEDEELTRENLKNVLLQGFSYDGTFGNLNILPGERVIEIKLYPVQYVEGGLKYLQ
ncbi:MAG: ABC transporter substrate-binding protein [Thiotrichaceae bacterium]